MFLWHCPYFSNDLLGEGNIPFSDYQYAFDTDSLTPPGGAKYLIATHVTASMDDPHSMKVVGPRVTIDDSPVDLPATMDSVHHHSQMYRILGTHNLVKLANWTSSMPGDPRDYCFDVSWGLASPNQGTKHQPISNVGLENTLDGLLVSATEEKFERGMDSDFAKGLKGLLALSPIELLRLLRIRLAEASMPVEVLAEAMRWLGEQEQKSIRKHIVSLLILGLQHTSSLVRDAGALALGRLEGSDSLIHLNRAIANETVPELCQDMKDLAESLQS
jgi:hypothetical protein